MKNLRFKIDIFGGLIFTFGALCMAIGPFYMDLWIIDVGGISTLIGCAVVYGSGRITRFIEKRR